LSSRGAVTRVLRFAAPHRRAVRLAAAAGAACLVAALAGCAPRGEPGEASGDPPPAASDALSRPEPGMPVTSGVGAPLPPAELLAQALADASRRSGVAQQDLVIVKSLRVTWRDGSLGCPEPGMSYTQALAPGWQLVIRAAGQDLDYRCADRGRFMLCPPGRGRDPAPGDVRDER
jgi:hypothetical protein